MLMDASAVVDLFLTSANTPRISNYIRRNAVRPCLCEFAVGEFASAVKRERGVGRLADRDVQTIFDAFDEWRASSVEPVATEAGDVRLAAIFVRRLDVNLRMPDAVYIATAQRLAKPLCSFDARQLAAAQAFGVKTVVLDGQA
jgi:predicted nucleic acid-binding protein